MARSGSKKPSPYSDDPRINQLLSRVIQELRSFTEEQADHIKDLAAIGRAMSAERDPERILEMILTQARRFTAADGGTLYLRTDDEKELAFHVLHNDTLKSYMGGTSGNPVTLPNVPLYDENGEPNHANVSAHVAVSGETVNIPDVYEAEGFNFDGPKKFDEMMGYRSMSMLVVPMRDHEDEIIGVLQLINAKDPESGESIPFSPDLVEMTEALASQAAVVLTQQRLIQDLKNLFESFIKAIATAIDEKSKYTGGHITRVAELTMMIAEKINEVDEGPFADVHFNRDELEELRIAAWMHDTGKITTPEYVVDKSNKLETIFDRIDLLRTRWDVIRLARELEVEREKGGAGAKGAGAKRVKEAEEKLAADLAAMGEDLAFLERTNTGGEFMADDKIERLQAIAARTYGVDGETHPFLTDDEVYNLSIRKGTLTAEEREIINNHAMMTIKILNELPWPKKLRRVPEFAGAHHEKLDGSGYPLGLTADQISLQARIMAVADIFEALSAKDRPYKKPMPLSQAIKILGFMVKDNHIDKDVVDLFIDSGLVHEYAERFLSPEQVDIHPGGEEEKAAG
ncbi:MAG TPA: GAF domain-containing protein [Bacteroidetes bacterium]|nr:GAF domain-containing protein [Bacteroidota bacterium]